MQASRKKLVFPPGPVGSARQPVHWSPLTLPAVEKCAPRGNANLARRCHRLKKPCSSQTPAPARKRKEPKPTRVAELERRLEDLTARIESVQRQGLATPSPPDSDHYALPSCPPAAAADPEDSLPPRNFSGTQVPIPTFGEGRWDSPLGHLFPTRSIFDIEPQPERQQFAANGRAVPATQHISPPAASGLSSAQTATANSTCSPPNQLSPSPGSQQQRGCPWPQGDEAEESLELYRKNLSSSFPFVIVPPHMSSGQLREQRPFLWKAVMVETCLFDGARQVALGKELLREVSEAAFVRPQKNIDLLQGLQMLIAWSVSPPAEARCQY